MTYSFGRICFAVGTPQDPGDDSRWECGCACTGPREAMRWQPCDEHRRFAAALTELTAAHAMSQQRDSA